MAAVLLSAMAAAFFITTSLFSGLGRRLDLKKARLKAACGKETTDVQSEMSFLQKLKDDAERRKAVRLRSRQLAESKSKTKPSLVGQMLQMAEVPLTEAQFTLVKAGVGLVLAVISYLISGFFNLDPKLLLLIPLAAFILGMILPGEWLTKRVAKKKAVYRDALADLMDLLVVSVEAGLGFDSALIRLHEKDQSPLMEEMMRTVQDVQRGMSKREAYENMAQRCDVKEITSFLNAMLQAEQLGISIKTVLRSQAEALRNDRRQRAEEKALKAPVKMLVPMVLFIFPVIFIVLLGPALMNILEMFS